MATCSTLPMTCSRRSSISSSESTLLVFGKEMFGTGTPMNEQSSPNRYALCK
jgi:hypothetical protein